MNIFPSTPGTFVATRDHAATHGVYYIPVVGWAHVQGQLAFPILPIAFGGLTHGKCIVTPEGFVTDPTHGQVFDKIEDWIVFIDKAKRKGDDPEPDGVATAAKDPAPTKPAAAKTAPSGPIVFGTKTYQSKSFWSYPEQNAIFELEGGVPYPKDDRVQKVTRDQFAALKRDGATKIDPNGQVEEDPAEDEDDDGGLV